MSCSYRCKACAATSPVTGKPASRASRSSATPSAELIWVKCTRAPVALASANTVCMASVSAATGIAASPRREASALSCAMPSLLRWYSAGCNQTGTSHDAAYCSARQSTRVSAGRPRPCDTAIQPASRSRLISASILPAKPCVIAPTGSTRTCDTSSAWRTSRSASSGSSSIGSTSGGHASVVTPPATAAASSASMLPAIRADKSTSPGATTSPCASMT